MELKEFADKLKERDKGILSFLNWFLNHEGYTEFFYKDNIKVLIKKIKDCDIDKLLEEAEKDGN